MIAAAVVFAYLAIVLYVGIFAFRKGTNKAEDFFVANRSLGTAVFLLSLFGSNMTSFAILGSSGLAFRLGIGVYGLMASISGIVIPLSIFIIGTRIWALGKKHGYMTQVQIFRDRWEMSHIGTFIFALQAIMLVPYIIIGVMGGGETLEGVSDGKVPYWLGGMIVALVVMSYVFFGGMRGTAWVNTLQTSMFLVFGTIAFIVIANGMGGLGKTVDALAATLNPPASQVAPAAPTTSVTAPSNSAPSAAATTSPATTTSPPAISSAPTVSGSSATTQPARPAPRPDGELLTRARISQGYYLSYIFIPLSSIMFPHIAIFCLTAKRMASFRKTVIFYPLCIMAIWLPAVFLGAITGSDRNVQVVAQLALKSEGFAAFEQKNPPGAALIKGVADGSISSDDQRAEALKKGPLKADLRRLAASNADGVMLGLLNRYAPAILAGLLGAAIMACVMASDSQILALSTMWAEDVFAHYGGKGRFGEAAQVWSARLFVVILTVIAYLIAISVHQYANIFEIAIQYAFSGYASLTPIMLACLFWKRSTKWGALAAAGWVAMCLVVNVWLQMANTYAGPLGGATPILSVGGTPILMLESTRVTFTEYRMLLVVPMIIGATLAMVVVSLLTRPPGEATLEKFFPTRRPANSP